MSVSGRKAAIRNAFNEGVRRCPCCNIQLVWKGVNGVTHARNLATVDHIIPRSFGGADHHKNLFVMCITCNNERSTKCFLDFMKDKNVCSKEMKRRYEEALNICIRQLIMKAFVSPNKTFKKQFEKIASMAGDYYGELPETFALFPLNKTYKIGVN